MSEEASEREQALEEMLEAAEDEIATVALAERAYNRNDGGGSQKVRLSNTSAPSHPNRD